MITRTLVLAGALYASVACGTEGRPATTQVWLEGPRLPQPVSNNAVAAVGTADGVSVFSFLGIDSTKVWSGVTNAAYRWDTWTGEWREIDPVPGPGRLASTAQVVDGRIYVIGGYTVAEDGSEKSLPDVAIYDPASDRWSQGADIPVPTDDAAAGLWGSDRIVLVSGWHDTGNIPDVQIYHPAADRWTQGTDIPGVPVFGHTGTMVGDDFVYVDGTAVVPARPRFAIDTASWRGRFSQSGLENSERRSSVDWVSAPPHPGPPLYRAAAATVDGLALFIGGSDNPYNYNGVGYDGEPSSPVDQVLAFDPMGADGAGLWRDLPAPPAATMDHRNAGIAGGRVYLVGGMVAGQVVSNRVWWAETRSLVAASMR